MTKASGPAADLAKLSKTEQVLVELSACFFSSVTRSTFARAIGMMKAWPTGGTPTASQIHPALRALTEAGWLESEDDAHWSTPAELGVVALRNAQRSGRFPGEVEIVQRIEPTDGRREDRIARDARLSLFAGDWEGAVSRLPFEIEDREEWLVDLCEGFGPDEFDPMPFELRSELLSGLVEVGNEKLVASGGPLEFLLAQGELTHRAEQIAAENLVLQGRFEEARALMTTTPLAARGLLAFAEGRLQDAVSEFDALLAAGRKRRSGKRPVSLGGRAGLAHAVSVLGRGTPESIRRAGELAKAGERTEGSEYFAYSTISLAAGLLEGTVEQEDLFLDVGRPPNAAPPITALFEGMALVWALSPDELEGAPLDALLALSRDASAAGYAWVASQAARCALAAGAKSTRKLRQAAETGPGADLSTLVQGRERWAEVLEALATLGEPAVAPMSRPAPAEGEVRVVWVVLEAKWSGGIEVEPRQQVLRKGKWSKGRRIGLERLYTNPNSVEGLTAIDRAVCRHIEERVTLTYGRYRDVSYYLDDTAALEVLAGHDGLFAKKGDTLIPAEVQRVEPKLRTLRKERHIELSLAPFPPLGNDQGLLRTVAPGRYEIVKFSASHRAIAKLLGKKGLQLPARAESRLGEALGAVAGLVSIEQDGALAASAGDFAETVVANPQPELHIRRFGEGLSLEAVVRPLGPTGPTVAPGTGNEVLVQSIDGVSKRAQRDLDAERRAFSALVQRLPTLAERPLEAGRWNMPARDQAFELLVELEQAQVPREWPDGAPIELSSPQGVDQLRLSLEESKDGFTLAGALAFDDEVVSLGEVLDYLSASPSRFIAVERQARVLALSEELRERLDELAALGKRTKAGLTFPRLVAPLVDDLTEGMECAAPSAFRELIERLRGRGAAPRVPTTLQADLRPYQEDGVRWLLGLADLGLGACLADDMGLGKTLQTIAVLLAKASEGPALVVAPTSVLSVWEEQLARFAPTLRAKVYAGPSRGGLLEQAGPFDVFITSYTLLQLDIESLGALSYEVVVLDEAQAIKNPTSQRAKAAGKLRAKARIATTGTPVENGLDELHSLMSFLNPGLLGSRTSFRQRFSAPILRGGNRKRQDQLRRMIRPFVLRRKKAEVLDELPPKTEVNLRVELSDAEVAVYEAIRARGLEEVSEVAEGKDRRMHILAALTKLRRAACSASLVDKSVATGASSTKLAALDDLLDELRPGNHRALVFSQFVDHLTLVRTHLDARGIAYQYLDGSTPVRARRKAVDAFQAGEGEVFLISLRAGGVGLDLTGADYVIHLDPWWNPAVEDQASDRAHRFGQQRPVSVYRVIAKDTVEDRILALHHKKRALAAAVLEGTESAGALSEEELLELLRHG